MLNLLEKKFIRIDQEQILRWLGLLNLENEGNSYFSNSVSEPSTDISVETLRVVIEEIWKKLEIGLTLNEVENIIYFILFVRFVILAIKYNLKTSFYITCIGFVSGYLWYRHFIHLIILYRDVLDKLPFFCNLGRNASEIRAINRQIAKNEIMLGDKVQWYNIGKLAYYSFTKGIVDVDTATGLRSYIDPISMIVSNLDEPLKSKVLPYYYKIYNKIIPKIFRVLSRLWSQLTGLIAYVLLTRVGKKYCPYLIRWHWTFIIILSFPEQILRYLTNRILYYQLNILIPEAMDKLDIYGFIDTELLLEVNFTTVLICTIAVLHVSFVLLCLLHAICGQYFYIAFLTENAELHIGPRLKTSIYSGGYTSWQDEKEKKRRLDPNVRFPTLWYGWLGKPSNSNWKPIQFIINYFERAIRVWIRKFRRK